MKNSTFPKPIYWLFATLIFLGSVLIRIEDINDLPLDFHPTRQLYSALKARGIYYQTAPDIPDWQRKMAFQQWKLQGTIEPEIIESLAVFAYKKIGKADLALPRTFSAIFWVIGGVFTFFAAKRLVSPDGALLTASFYLFLPYGVFASRSFQPDPLMVMLIDAFIWALVEWEEFSTKNTENIEIDKKRKRKTWVLAIFSGLFGGLAILVKMTSVFFIAGGAIVVVLRTKSLKEALKDTQIWVIGLLAVLPISIYFFYGVILDGFLTQQFGGRFFPEMLLQPSFYLRWGLKLEAVVGYLAISFSLLGLALFPKKKIGIMLGLWGGYIFYGLYFNYHFSTHDYYQMPFIPVAALSLAPLGETLSKRFRTRVSNSVFPRIIFGAAWTLALLGAAWTVRSEMRAVDYRPLAETYREIGDLLRGEGNVIALAEDYGNRLDYWGWFYAAHFPYEGDLWYQDKRGDPQDIEQIITKRIEKYSFFLVTNFEEWEKQDELRAYLFSNYSLFVEDDSYLIFDLR